MRLKNLFGLIVAVAISASCSKETTPCSNASNVDDPACQKNIRTIDTRTVTLDMSFADSFYYNRTTKSWNTITKENLEGGITGGSLPIYSSFLNISADEAVLKIESAKAQLDNQANYLETDLNQIPYIEVTYTSGYDYVYSYVKTDLNNNPVASVTGKLIIKNNRAYLPLVNAMFGNQFYSATDVVGKRYLHSIAISAQTNSQSGSTPKKVSFESTLEAPIVDFTINYSDAAKAFNLDNRFNYYFANNTDNVINTEFPFFTLKQTGDAQAVPVDIRILFKEKPVLKISQELFFENPFNLDKYKTTGVIELIRGESFYVSTSQLDSNSHFKLKVKMNNQIRNLIDGREFQVPALPAGTPWDISFAYDFTTNSAFSDPQGLDLITPLKPNCNEIVNTPFKPLKAVADKALAKSSGGFLSVCHPDLNDQKFLNATQLATTTMSLSDSYFGFFNYIPQDTLKDVGGNFNGLRTVTLSLEGCMRVYVKTPTSTTWELKSQGNNACVVDGETDTAGWVYFNASKTYTINDLLSNYEGIAGLKTLIQSFSTKPIRRTPNFKFNGQINNTNHVY